MSKVLEYVQGIAEVKNFDLTHDSATQVHGAVEEARKASFAMELPSCSICWRSLLSTSSPALRLRGRYRLLLQRHHGADKLPFDADLLVHPL